MKRTKLIGIGIAVVIAAVLTCVGIKLHSDAGYYYTQIDNSKAEQIESNGGVIDFNGGMSYSYSLPAFNEKCKERDIKFGTEKKLKEGAFLCLTVKSVQGVVDWKEVRYDELPEEIRENFTAPQK